MTKCLLSRPGLIAGPLHSTPLQINSQSIPRLDQIDSKSSLDDCQAAKSSPKSKSQKPGPKSKSKIEVQNQIQNPM